MAKNNKLINNLAMIARRNRAEHIERASMKLTPHVYAGIALALHRQCGWGFKRINRLFAESQRIWEADNGDMVEQCARETGIVLMNPEDAEKEGYFKEDANE